ncbi:YDG domain-containing protein, partial [Zwartia sp.]|uniref:YDG domain-containing protein n=1 Tax=Zwartia sp. TaxID=2978004 RepID=UPI00271CEFCC
TANTTTATTADITPAPLTVTATGIDKVYDTTVTGTVTLAATPLAGDTVTLANTTADYLDKNVGVDKTINVSGISLDGADAGNYTFNETAVTTADITPAPLIVSATGVDKVYDTTVTDSIMLTATPITGDTVMLASTTADFTDKNVGVDKTINVSGISLSGTDAGNYTANATAVTTADIIAAPLVVTATGTDKVYDATTTDSVTLSATPLAGDMLVLHKTDANFFDKNVGTDKSVTVTGITLTGADAENYIPNTTAVTTATITAAALEVSATGTNKVFDATTSDIVTLAASPLAGDIVVLHNLTANFTDMYVGTDKTVNVTGIALTGADASNYIVNTTAKTFADIIPITPASPDIPNVKNIVVLTIIPITPFLTDNASPVTLQKDTLYGGFDAEPIVPFAMIGVLTKSTPNVESGFDGGSAAATLFLSAQTLGKLELLSVSRQARPPQLLKLYSAPIPKPYFAPQRAPKQGRN